MRKSFLIILLTVAAFSLKAQQQSPLFFHNHQEYMNYRMEHPERIPQKAMESYRHNYTQKLDSVVGSDRFDWTRWMNVYTYVENADAIDSLMVVETSYEWQEKAWMPTLKTEIIEQQEGDCDELQNHYRWTDGDWELSRTVMSYYSTHGDEYLLDSVVTLSLVDSLFEPTALSSYEYNDNCQLVLNMNYNGKKADGEWRPASRNVYTYEESGVLSSRVYSTIRSGSWSDSQRDSYSYDDQNHCTSVLTQRRSPWGSGWMNDHKYVFEYEDDKLAAELLYLGGWYGGEMTLDSKVEYFFDANGNEERKTASVFNEIDWIERDVYENHFDLSVSAEEVLGLTSVWESTLGKGLGYVLDMEMPLVNKWLSCSIISTNMDTEFTLYCSGFAGVEEHREDGFMVCSGEGRLAVENAEPHDVTVYDLLGRVVASRKNAIRCEFQLNAGLYVVGNGTSFVKAVVR